MNKYFIIAITIILTSLNAFTMVPEGNGSQNTPYLIQNLENLRWLSETNDWYIDDETPIYFKQTANLDATSTTFWNDNAGFTPIGKIYSESVVSFFGEYDGDGYSITGLTVRAVTGYNTNGGMFRELSNSVVKNLNLISINITGYANIGAIAGSVINNSILTNISVTGNIHGGDSIGGIVGILNNSTIKNSISSANVSSTGNSGKSGGIAGNANNSVIELCYVTRNVSNTGSNGYSGGIAGYAERTTIINCFANARIVANHLLSSRVGGIVGELNISSMIINSYVRGVVEGVAMVGGITGSMVNNSSINYSYVAANIHINSSQPTLRVGAISGFSANSLVTHTLIDETLMPGIDIIGHNNSGASATIITETDFYTSIQMKLQDTYENLGWNFFDIWDIDPLDNDGYPYLIELKHLTPPSYPKPVNFTAVFEKGSVELRWELPTINTRQLVGFRIFRSDDNSYPIADNITSTFYTDNSITISGKYSYAIQAIYYEEAISDFERSPAIIVTLPPEQIVTDYSGFHVILNWQPALGGSMGYRVYRICDIEEKVLHSGLIETTYFTDNTTKEGVVYTYQVAAVHMIDEELIESDKSDAEITVETPYFKPPRNFERHMETNEEHIFLTWEVPEPGNFAKLTGYIIQRMSIDDGEITEFEVENDAVMFIDDNNLVNGFFYLYSILAKYSEPEGKSIVVPASQIHFIVLHKPRNLKAVSGDAIVSLSWELPSINRNLFLQGFDIYRNDEIYIQDFQATIFEDVDVKNNTFYTYYVKAVYNFDSISEPSNIEQINTAFIVQDFHATLQGKNVLLTWMQPKGDRLWTGYRIYRDDVLLASPSASIESIVDDTTVQGARHEYKISAIYGNNESPAVSLFMTIPVFPQPNLLETIVSGNSVEIRWEAPSVETLFIRFNNDDLSNVLLGYKLLRNQNLIHNDVINDLFYLDNDLQEGTYQYSLFAVYERGDSEPVDFEVTITILNNDDLALVYTNFLKQNFPNPFNPSTVISFYSKEENNVKIEIFNIKGQKIRTLTENNNNAGYNELLWNGKDDSGRNVESGVYFYRMTADDYIATHRMTLLK